MSAKRGNNEGSLTRRPDGRWEARITLENGQRKSFYAATRQAAARKLAAALRDRDAGLPIVGDKQTLAQFLGAWLETIHPNVKPKTYRSYEQLLRVHVLPTLGDVPLSKLSAQQLQVLYARRLEAGSSTTTVHHVHAVLHRALESAFRLGLVQRNVGDLVDAPRMRHHELRVLTPSQVRTLLDAAKGDRLEALYVVALSTGMRQGELLALKWSHVDLDRRVVMVMATVQYVKGGGYTFLAPKTRRSRRKIALPLVAVEALRRHKDRQQLERLRLGHAWEDLDLVFANAIGRPLDGTNVLRQCLHPLLLRAGLPLLRFHDLRHTAATLLFHKGVHPKIVSELLGHATVSITLDIYSHMLPDMQEQASAAMDDMLKADESHGERGE